MDSGNFEYIGNLVSSFYFGCGKLGCVFGCLLFVVGYV